MKQKLDLISPLSLPPPVIAPKKPWEKKLDRFLRILLRSEMEKEKRKETEKNQSFGSRLISWFWYLFVPAGFYFLLVDPVILVLMIGLVIFMAYIKNLAFKVDSAPSAPNKWAEQKLAPIPLTLYPTEEPYKPSYSELMAEF